MHDADPDANEPEYLEQEPEGGAGCGRVTTL